MIRTNLGVLVAQDLLKLQQLERVADLPVVDYDGRKINVPTIAFLALVQAYFGKRWRRKIDPTQAYQLWSLYRAAVAKFQEQFVAAADIAHWFNLDATKLPGEMVLGLLANLYRVQAQEQLLHGSFDALDHEAVFNLVLAATGDERQALHARSQSMRALIDRETAKHKR